MTEQRRTSDIKEEINYLNPLLADRLTLCEFYPEDEALKISANQLMCRRDELVREFQEAANAEYNNAYSMKITGNKVFNGSIPASVLSKIIGSFQDSITAIANKKQRGEQSRGRISQEIINATEINVSVAAVGSYQIIFTGSMPSITPGEKSIQMQAMQILSDTINFEDDSEKVKSFKAEMGPRVFNKYKSMIEVLNANDVSLTLFENSKNLEKVEISSEIASKILKRIDSLKGKPDEEITLEGRIIDVDYDRGHFTLNTNRGDIRCKYNSFPDKIMLLNNLDKYSMKFLVKRTYNETRDSELSKYIALSFELLKENAYLNEKIDSE